MTPGSLMVYCFFALIMGILFVAATVADIFFSDLDTRPRFSLASMLVGAMTMSVSIAGLIAGFIWFLVDEYAG